MAHHLLISAGLSPDVLDSQVAIVTGAGSGVGVLAENSIPPARKLLRARERVLPVVSGGEISS
jgi:hypothetical protein